MAVTQGYYREAGLEVELCEAVPGRDPVQAVLAGEANSGVGTSELVLLRPAGQPVVVLAAISRRLAGLLGGTVCGESTSGHGSVFTVEIVAPVSSARA